MGPISTFKFSVTGSVWISFACNLSVSSRKEKGVQWMYFLCTEIVPSWEEDRKALRTDVLSAPIVSI